jgi:hypothetical protein
MNKMYFPSVFIEPDALLAPTWSGFSDRLYRLNPLNLEWRDLNLLAQGSFPQARSYHGFASLNGRLYTFGGWGVTGLQSQITEHIVMCSILFCRLDHYPKLSYLLHITIQASPADHAFQCCFRLLKRYIDVRSHYPGVDRSYSESGGVRAIAKSIPRLCCAWRASVCICWLECIR